MLLRLSALPSLFGWGIDFLRNSTPERYHANLARNARIAEYSLKVLQNLRAEHKLPYDHGTEGTMKIFRERRALDTTAQLAEQLQQHGVQCHIIDTNAAIEVEPAIAPLKDEIVGAAFYPHDEHGDAFQFCAAMSDYAQQAGAEFRFNTTVTGLQGDPTAMTGVRTTSGVLTADAYVLAAGSHTPTLAKELELEIPVRPVKGYSVTTRLNGWSEPPKLPVIDEALHAGVTPLGDRLRSVGTAEFAGYDSRLKCAAHHQSAGPAGAHLSAIRTLFAPRFSTRMGRAAANVIGRRADPGAFTGAEFVHQYRSRPPWLDHVRGIRQGGGRCDRRPRAGYRHGPV